MTSRMVWPVVRPKARADAVALLLGQFKSPMILICFLAAGLSFFLHDSVNAGLTLLLPYSPVPGIFGFEPLPLSFLFFPIAIVLLYIAATELAKRTFYKGVKY